MWQKNHFLNTPANPQMEWTHLGLYVIFSGGNLFLAHFLTKLRAGCKNIFLSNHPCSKTDTITYDMLEGIEDGYKVSAKYDTQGLIFKTPDTVTVFSNGYPRAKALKRDRWRFYEIIDEDLCDKTTLLTKPRWLTFLWRNVGNIWSQFNLHEGWPFWFPSWCANCHGIMQPYGTNPHKSYGIVEFWHKPHPT